MPMTWPRDGVATHENVSSNSDTYWLCLYKCDQVACLTQHTLQITFTERVSLWFTVTVSLSGTDLSGNVIFYGKGFVRLDRRDTSSLQLSAWLHRHWAGALRRPLDLSFLWTSLFLLNTDIWSYHEISGTSSIRHFQVQRKAPGIKWLLTTPQGYRARWITRTCTQSQGQALGFRSGGRSGGPPYEFLGHLKLISTQSNTTILGSCCGHFYYKSECVQVLKWTPTNCQMEVDFGSVG